MAPVLYMVPPSPPVRAVLITAKAIGLDLIKKEIDLAAGDHLKPDFLKINPQHSVPTLVDDDGFTIWESHAIMIYLVSKYGNNDDSLYPNDLKKRAIIHQRLDFDLSVVFPKIFKIADPIIQGTKKGINEKDVDGANEIYGFLEAFLERNKWICGDSVTIADYALISSISSLRILVPIEKQKYSKVSVWLENGEKLPEYQANKDGLEIFTNVIKSKLLDINFYPSSLYKFLK